MPPKQRLIPLGIVLNRGGEIASEVTVDAGGPDHHVFLSVTNISAA
jgi:hypothetical protein